MLTYVPEEGAAQLGAHCGYAPGAQVFDSYGPGLSPGDLLLDYGFVDPANDNHRCVGVYGCGSGGRGR